MGEWAYLATNVTEPQEIYQDSFGVSLKWRKWLGQDFGIKTGIGYFHLEDGYEKYGIDFGIFKDF